MNLKVTPLPRLVWTVLECCHETITGPNSVGHYSLADGGLASQDPTRVFGGVQYLGGGDGAGPTAHLKLPTPEKPQVDFACPPLPQTPTLSFVPSASCVR